MELRYILTRKKHPIGQVNNNGLVKIVFTECQNEMSKHVEYIRPAEKNLKTNLGWRIEFIFSAVGRLSLEGSICTNVQTVDKLLV